MMPSAKAALAAGLAVAMLVIAIMARECTHRGREAEFERQLDAMTVELQDRDSELKLQAGCIDALRAELDAAAKIHTAIETVRTEAGETKELIHETISNNEESRYWYMERIPDAVLRAFDVRMCSAGKDRDADRVCRAE